MTTDESVQFAGLTDIGRLRATNQDRWGAYLEDDGGPSLFIVADGVACSTDGALAATLVVELLPTYISRYLQIDADDAAEAVERGVVEYCGDFLTYADTDARAAGANTTVVAAIVAGSRALITHLGDSRAYLFREQRLDQLTRDHSLIQELIDAGRVAPEDADRHPARATLTRHVAMRPRALPEVAAVDLLPGDRILLSSDGLHGVIDDAALSEILQSHADPTEACAAMIKAALEAGGPDNITAVVVNVPDPADGP